MINNYDVFVDTLLSEPSSDFKSFIKSLDDLKDNGCEIHRLMTGAVGLCAESGEFMEIVKKMVFQGKPYNEDNIFHMKRELGDIIFYFQTICLSLNISMDDIISENIKKLESRYPGGKFEVSKSEIRQEGDI